MKKAPSVLLRLCCAIAFGAYPFSPLTAQTLEWDTDTSITGPQGAVTVAGWNAGPFWWDGTANVSWINGSDAVFGGTPGAVNDAAVTVDDITFTVPDYVLRPSGTDFGLRLDGGEGAHVITVSASASILHRLTGSEGFTKEGPGQLFIGAANHSFVGTITINAGEVRISR